MMKTNAQPPVALLGGLNIVRALGLAGIPVIIASSARRTPSMCWLHFAYDRRAYRALAARGELGPLRWIRSLLETRIRTAFARRMHRWLATAS